MNASNEEKPNLIKELHRDLERKYQVHGTKIEQIWRSFSQIQRAKALKAGAANGQVLKDPLDRTMGDVYKILPELNLRDITEPESDYLLDLLKHRATKSLSEQYREGVNGGQGDAAFIASSMSVNNLRPANSFKHSFTLFVSEDTYGQSYKATDRARYDEMMAGLSVAVNAGLCVPQSTGEMILERQLYILQTLNILVEDILEGGSLSRSKEKRPRKPQEATDAALSKLSIDPKSENLSLKDMLASALDQKSSLDDYLSLCRTEPVFLARVVNNWFFSRPELVQDEKGRTMPLLTDKYISVAIFEVIHNAAAEVAIWDYIYRLLQALVDGSNDKLYKGIIMQEVSNVCHFEYGRAQKLFKRYVQFGTGSKYFKRIAGVYDNGVARVTMKVKPEAMTRENPQVHYMLRLCQSETDAAKAVDWIKKLDELHRTHPSVQDDMNEVELDAFGDLAVTASFIHSLSTVLPLPPINPRKGQVYISRSKELAAELDPLKNQIDLADFAAPIDNLTEPGMAERALNTLDQFVRDEMGAMMDFLYQHLIEDCVSHIQKLYQQQKAQVSQKAKTEFTPAATTPMAETQSEELGGRKRKMKTRVKISDICDTAPTTITSAQNEITESPPTLKVNQNTFEVFSTMFSKSQSRGSINWSAFTAAMKSLEFSIVPGWGSAFTFSPSPVFVVQKSITIHRPHKSQLEGHKLLFIAKRLQRVYGWGEKTFEVA